MNQKRSNGGSMGSSGQYVWLVIVERMTEISLEPGTCTEPTLISRTPWLWARRPEAWSTMSTRIRWIIVMVVLKMRWIVAMDYGDPQNQNQNQIQIQIHHDDGGDQNNKKNLRRTKRRKVDGHRNTSIEAEALAHNTSYHSLTLSLPLSLSFYCLVLQ